MSNVAFGGDSMSLKVALMITRSRPNEACIEVKKPLSDWLWIWIKIWFPPIVVTGVPPVKGTGENLKNNFRLRSRDENEEGRIAESLQYLTWPRPLIYIMYMY